MYAGKQDLIDLYWNAWGINRQKYYATFRLYLHGDFCILELRYC